MKTRPGPRPALHERLAAEQPDAVQHYMELEGGMHLLGEALTSGHSGHATTAGANTPNPHHLICRDGEYGQNSAGSYVLPGRSQQTCMKRKAIVNRRHIILPVAVLLLSACDAGPVGPAEMLSAAQLDALGLATEIVIDRSEVAQGGEFAVSYTIRNTGSAPVRLESACVAVARGVVLRNGNVVDFMGSGSGCYTAIGTHDIAAGETLQRTWQVRAAIIVQWHPDGREPDTKPAPAGEYVFRLKPDVLTVNGMEAQLPVIEQKFTVH